MMSEPTISSLVSEPPIQLISKLHTCAQPQPFRATPAHLRAFYPTLACLALCIVWHCKRIQLLLFKSSLLEACGRSAKESGSPDCILSGSGACVRVACQEKTPMHMRALYSWHCIPRAYLLRLSCMLGC